MRAWTVLSFVCLLLCALTGSSFFCGLLSVRAFTVFSCILAWPCNGPCFWGSRNCINCLSLVPVRRTTCASIATIISLMDFGLLCHSAAGRPSGLWSCVVVLSCFRSQICNEWHDLVLKFTTDPQPDGWTFQPHSFAAPKLVAHSLLACVLATQLLHGVLLNICSSILPITCVSRFLLTLHWDSRGKAPRTPR